MCGFAGFWGGQWPEGETGATALLRRMNDTLIRRGPDSDGYWVDGEAGIALGHRRLAILDLSAAGAQPMAGARRPTDISLRIRAQSAADTSGLQRQHRS